MSSFKILYADYKKDYEEWISLWRNFKQQEVFSHPLYVKLFCRKGENTICATWRSKEGCILFPLILRPLENEEWIRNDSELKKLSDLSSPYGYGGPYFEGKVDVDDFWNAFFEYAIKMRIVTCFIRLALFPDQIISIKIKGTVREVGYNVVRNLNISEEDIWFDYEHKVRKNVNRARREGLSIEMNYHGNNIDKFCELYYHTMQRRGASNVYIFKKEFFQNLINDLKGNYAFFFTIRHNEILSTELVLISKDYVYSFLGGTKEDSFILRPNDLLKHEIILWAKAIGKKGYVLGGGYNCKNDGVFRYKKSFAPNGIVVYKVAEIIFDEELYNLLVQKRFSWELKNDKLFVQRDNYFPLYRC